MSAFHNWGPGTRVSLRLLPEAEVGDELVLERARSASACSSRARRLSPRTRFLLRAPSGAARLHVGPSVRPDVGAAMSLCFIEPQDAIRVIADSVGREARRQIVGEVVGAWVDEIPEPDLLSHYSKAVADLDEHDLSLLAAWHASLEVGHPLPNKEFLVNVFPSLGENRREALRIAAGSAARRRSRPASARTKRSTPCCPGCRRSAASSSPASASSCTAGTGSAARTSRRLAQRD